MFVTEREDNLPDGLFKTTTTDPVFPVNLVIFKSTEIISTSVILSTIGDKSGSSFKL